MIENLGLPILIELIIDVSVTKRNCSDFTLKEGVWPPTLSFIIGNVFLRWKVCNPDHLMLQLNLCLRTKMNRILPHCDETAIVVVTHLYGMSTSTIQNMAQPLNHMVFLTFSFTAKWNV